jgi:hypothetical protein
VHWIPLDKLCVIGDGPENLGEILVYEPPLIAIFGDRMSGWWRHEWKRGAMIRNIDDRRALLVGIPDVLGAATSWDPVQ